MKFLQIALGSMGKRRIRCLKALGETDIIAFDPREDRRAEAAKLYGVKTVDTLEAGFAQKPDAVLVSTPPDMHYEFVKAALEQGMHCFCEANIISDGAGEFFALAEKKKVVAAPSATFRFHPLYQRLRELVHEGDAFGKPLVLNFHMGNYILDWHPWEGLNFYAGRKATGACREMIPFEFEWMQWIFGPVQSVQCTLGKTLDLPTDMDDTYAVVAKFESGLIANVMVEVVARYPIRAGRLLSQKGNITWDFDTNLLKHYDGETKVWREYKAAGRGFNIEEMYVAEIDAYLKACRGEQPWTHTYHHDRDLGRILLACEQSHETGRRVNLSEIPV
jgi:predicted dehydrogenase